MKYVVAVSGGIDSVVLLDMLVSAAEHDLVVAHVDHGIREDSREDETFVASLAGRYTLSYESVHLDLGSQASEEYARDARYTWLRSIQKKHEADAIVTAHHQDDVLETMIINLIRGTGWRGLCSLAEHARTKRPLLTLSKAEIIQYALEHNLEWRDDSTNENTKYLRNYVRYRYVQRMDASTRNRFIALYNQQTTLKQAIEYEVVSLQPQYSRENGLSRYMLIMSGAVVAAEIIQERLGMRLEKSVMTQIWHFVCTGQPSKTFRVSGVIFRVTTRELFVSTSDI